MRNKSFAIVCALILTACGNSARQQRPSADELYQHSDSALASAQGYSDTIEIHYAQGLAVSYEADGIHVVISNPDPNARNGRADTLVINRPAQRFICTTALQLGNFEILGLEDRIVGMNSVRHLFSAQMQNQIESGKTRQIGREGVFDVETILSLQPDYIFVSASKYGGFDVLRDCGIPLIPHHGYKETDPLGQAEWIKLIGLLTGEPRRANAIFSDIEQKYLTLRDEVAGACAKEDGTKPTVASGRQLRDGWYIVGGRSYMARLFSDAGARYVMADNQDSGGKTINFESAYALSQGADFWQTDGSYAGDFTMETLAAENECYTTMNAYRNKRVIFCNLRQTPYRELAGVQPHILLADFVKAFHPELLPNYQPRYYKLLTH
ncbi:MAG: ABC transporter substrate-binding protein [Bacteroidaceae bacterium]|nr:ABC transporter substrate-binding protein [Bacteroidaceae bacterium]